MKLQKRLSRIYKGKKYYKYILVIPKRDIRGAKFKEGDELKTEVGEKEIKITEGKF